MRRRPNKLWSRKRSGSKRRRKRNNNNNNKRRRKRGRDLSLWILVLFASAELNLPPNKKALQQRAKRRLICACVCLASVGVLCFVVLRHHSRCRLRFFLFRCSFLFFHPSLLLSLISIFSCLFSFSSSSFFSGSSSFQSCTTSSFSSSFFFSFCSLSIHSPSHSSPHGCLSPPSYVLLPFSAASFYSFCFSLLSARHLSPPLSSFSLSVVYLFPLLRILPLLALSPPPNIFLPFPAACSFSFFSYSFSSSSFPSLSPSPLFCLSSSV